MLIALSHLLRIALATRQSSEPTSEPTLIWNRNLLLTSLAIIVSYGLLLSYAHLRENSWDYCLAARGVVKAIIPRMDPACKGFIEVPLPRQRFVNPDAQADFDEPLPDTLRVQLDYPEEETLEVVFHRLGTVVRTQGAGQFSILDTTLPFRMDVKRPINVYLLLNSYNTHERFRGQLLGIVLLTFKEVPPDKPTAFYQEIIVGRNIREWAVGAFDIVATFDRKFGGTYLQRAWGGKSSTEKVIDLLIVPIPSEYRMAILSTVSLIDQSHITTKDHDPGFRLQGLLVEYR